VVECTANPLKYLPGGIVRLVHSRVPHGPSFTIVGERYRFLGRVYVDEKAELSDMGSTSTGSVVWSESNSNNPSKERLFVAHTSEGCEPHPFELVYGLLSTTKDTVLARLAGRLEALHRVAVPPQLHTSGMLVYGAFSTLPTELVVHDARGRTVFTEDRGKLAELERQQCKRGVTGTVHVFSASGTVHRSR
jgi:hypothetical protein